jgi:hypothetical protein
MSRIFLTVLASVVVAAPGLTLAAQRPAAYTIASYAHSSARAPDTARITAVLAKGDSLEVSGRVTAARRQYRALVDQQREAGQYPVEALWRLANSYYFQNDELRTAATLDELAEAAGQYGDPTTELRASFESAVLYQRHKQAERVAQRVLRVRALLHSPAIDEVTKREFAKRIADGESRVSY